MKKLAGDIGASISSGASSLAKKAIDAMPSADAIKGVTVSFAWRVDASSILPTAAKVTDLFGQAKDMARLEAMAKAIGSSAKITVNATKSSAEHLSKLAGSAAQVPVLVSLSTTLMTAQEALAAKVAVSPELRDRLSAVNTSLVQLKALPADAKTQIANSLQQLADNLQAVKSQVLAASGNAISDAGAYAVTEFGAYAADWLLNKLLEAIIESLLKAMLEQVFGSGAELVTMFIPELGLLEILLHILL